jgi:hypothetical protein
MVPASDYGELASMELAREAFGTYTTLASPAVMRRARVRLSLYAEKLESIVETPLHGGGKLLLGRRILNTIDLALLGKSGKACSRRRAHRQAVRPKAIGSPLAGMAQLIRPSGL